MIIQNNFNSKSAEPRSDYKSIGEGRNSFDNATNMDNEKLIRDNLNNGVIQDIMNKDNEYNDDTIDDSDRWGFFR